MFEDLKARQSGFTAKEKTRLIVMVSAAALLGCTVLGLKGCEPDTSSVLPQVGKKDAEPSPRDTGPVRLAVKTSGVALGTFDKPSLDLVIREVRGGRLPREPQKRLTVAEVTALDPAEVAGISVETVGRLRSLEHESYPDGPADVDQLWAFALEGDDGKSVVVVHPGSTQALGGGAPTDAYHPGAAAPLLKNGDFVRARGIYLQKRTGTVGAVALSEPTPVLVGREYRRTSEAKPIERIDQADWADVHDRSNAETRAGDEDAQFQVLAWAQAKGHAAVAAMIEKKEIPVESWGLGRFLQWDKEIRGDEDQDLPDPRTMTLAARGKVFETTGALAYYAKEEWDTIPNNVGDVGARWKMWILSDWYHNAPIRFESPYPITDFAGIFPPPERALRRQRVRAFGVFYKNSTFTPGVVTDKPGAIPAGMKTEVTLPSFILLHLEPRAPIVGAPYYENPFFWTWVSLVVFGAAFFFVMHRIEKRESTQMQDQSLRLRRRRRELDAARGGASPAGAEPPASEGAPPPAADPSGAPPAGSSPPPVPPSP